MREDGPRTPQYAKDSDYERALRELNEQLAALPAGDPGPVRRPVAFIVGQPRSGTTLLYSVLAATGAFGYPTNFIARFYARPAVGARAQRLAGRWLERGPFSFESRAGATEAWYEPHEFGYFWERHFPFGDHHQPDAEALAQVDTAALARDFAELQLELDRPLLFKNLILDFVVEFLAGALPTSRFVRVRRPPLDVAQSLIRTRREFYGSPEPWFSVRPRDAAELASADVSVQVAHQIASIEQALDGARDRVGADRWLELDYTDLCARPHDAARAVAGLCAVDAAALDLAPVPEAFDRRPGRGADPAHIDAIRAELSRRGLDPGG